ncbi:MAG: hypothetical protein CMB16_01985 [Euryarchaeota archaeon]|nr:hypothetical protein [Euryarchaeota archaeon]
MLQGLGIILVAAAIIMGLRLDNPLIFDSHILMLICGLCCVFFSIVINRTEERFASKYDMTHILDLDNKEDRYKAYLSHLSNWIAPEMEEMNPTMSRAKDPSGPDWGKTDFKLGQAPERRDAIIEGQKYTGLEDDLTLGEKMIEDANKRYANIAQQRWEEAESNDPDLIEYGVEKLGDLVRTDYFIKNAEDGAFSKALGKNDNGMDSKKQ